MLLCLLLAAGWAAAEPAVRERPAGDGRGAQACALDASLCARARGLMATVHAALEETDSDLQSLQQSVAQLVFDVDALAELERRRGEAEKWRRNDAAAWGTVAARQAYGAFQEILEPDLQRFYERLGDKAEARAKTVAERIADLDQHVSRVEGLVQTPALGPQQSAAIDRELALLRAKSHLRQRDIVETSLALDRLGDKFEWGADLGDAAKPSRLTRAGLLDRDFNVVQTRAADAVVRLHLAQKTWALRRRELEGPGRSPGEPPPPELERIQRPGTRRVDGRDAFPDETAAAMALKLRGETETVGNPAGRARYVFKQKGSTCGIAAAAMVMSYYGRVPPTQAGLSRLEDELFHDAVVRAWFAGATGDPQRRYNGGLHWSHLGSFLGVPMRKLAGASPADLDREVMAGKIMIAVVMTRGFYNMRDLGADPGIVMRFLHYMTNTPRNTGFESHAFVITGGEVDQRSGEVVGYYVNDSNTGEGARFIARRQLLGAWMSAGGFLIVPE